jgi:hypothetical protein
MADKPTPKTTQPNVNYHQNARTPPPPPAKPASTTPPKPPPKKPWRD